MQVKYQIVSTSTASFTGQGAIAVPQPGRIYAVVFRTRASGGAGNGFYSLELTVNNGFQSQSETNNPPRQYAVASFTHSVGNGSFSSNASPAIPVDIAFKAGDVLYLNCTQTGTAAASAAHIVDVYVKE